ncbi:WRKY transcription factor WRKY24 [Dendrobium catenatum]|nr:WRKY transcription factor WRKY24 [Dendrobium catenatum]
MTPSSSSFVTSENSVPILPFSTSSSSQLNTFLRASEAVGEERSTFRSSNGFKSTVTTSSLFPNASSSFSPPPFLSLPGGLSPAVFLNSPIPLSSSNAQILASEAIGSTFPTQTITWTGNNTNYLHELKEDRYHNKSYSNFSFETSTRPASLKSSSFHPSTIGFMASEEEAFEAANQQSWSYQQPPLITSNDQIPNLQASSQSEYNCNYSNISAQSLREQRRLDDGYNWRKYGQKKVKGTENPRSYYKCTYPNCPTKKMVERSLDGHITEIIYKGTHSHPKPQRIRKNSSSFEGFQGSTHHEGKDHSFNGQFGSITTENSSAYYGDAHDINMNSQRMRAVGPDYDDDEADAKKWKMEGEVEGISISSDRTVREPKVMVQTTSDIDVLDDGYRWRKYGQKVVKGNPNPRSYYKCTTLGCSVRKHIERASTDLRAVITTYEGKHNHDVPAPRGSGGLTNKTSFDDNNNIRTNNSSSSSSYNMSNFTMAVRPSVASNSFFSPRTNGMDGIGFFRYENSMNSLFANELQKQNQLQHLQKQGESVLSKAKKEPRDDLFTDSLLG